MPVCTKSEQTGIGPCYEISQSSDSIICRKNIHVKWQFLSSDLLVCSFLHIDEEANDATKLSLPPGGRYTGTVITAAGRSSI